MKIPYEAASPANLDFEQSSVRFNGADSLWLQALSNRDVSKGWVTWAEELAVIGSSYPRDGVALPDDPKTTLGREEVIGARKDFFADHLGWADEEHPLHKAFKVMEKEDQWPNLATFVDTQRLLSDREIDAVELIYDYPKIVYRKKDSIGELLQFLDDKSLNAAAVVAAWPNIFRGKIENFQAATSVLTVENLDVPGIVKKFPKIMGYNPELIGKRINQVRLVADLMGWKGSPDELINYFPSILIYSDSKLRAHLRLMMRFGSQDATNSQITGHVIRPLEAHILAAVQFGEDYRNSHAGAIQKGSSDVSRKQQVDDFIQNRRPELEAVIGSKGVRDYLRYRDK